MIIRSDIEIMVQTIVSERLADIAESMRSQAYYLRDHSGAMESAIAGAFDEIERAIRSNIEEAP